MHSSEIKDLRNRLYLTQKELAELLSVETNTVARWERGESNISSEMVDRLRNVTLDLPSGNAISKTSAIAVDSYHQAILQGLNGRVDPEAFEACAITLLQVNWPGLVHVRGGSDDGFDGAVADKSVAEPFPLIVTTSQQPLANFRKNLDQTRKKNWNSKKVLFATSRQITPKMRKKFFEVARERKVTLVQIYDQDWFASRLYHNPNWCKRLLDISGCPHALSIFPITNRHTLGNQVLGREKEMQWLMEDSRGDCMLIGEPGSGKTFILRSLALQGKALFLVEMNREQVANDIRSLEPQSIIVDDAHAHQDWIEELIQLRRSLRAEFRIIAVSWLSASNGVQTALGVGQKNCCVLEKVTADVMIQIIKSAGLAGPDELLKVIRKQALGKPGLAATLVQMCLVGDVMEVLHGESLVNQIELNLEALLGVTSLSLLGVLALGGNSGVQLDKVANQLNKPIDEIANCVVKLAASGIIVERRGGDSINNCTLSIVPVELQGPLVRRVFYRGAGSLPVEKFLPIVEKSIDALEVLIYARSCGASVFQLENWLEAANFSTLWQKYARIGSHEATYVVENHPELLLETTESALVYIPEKSIPMLLVQAEQFNSNSQRTSFTFFQPQNPVLEKLSAWIEYCPHEYNWRLTERKFLVKCSIEYWNSSGNAQVTIPAMCIALKPVYSFSQSDPGIGNQFTITKGVLPADVIEQLSEELWPQLVAIINESEDVPWIELLDFLTDFLNPLLWNSDEIKVVSKQFLLRAFSDVLKMSSQHPGVQRRLKQFADSVGINESYIVSDSLFDYFYPTELNPNLDHLDKLAKTWADKPVDEIAHQLIQIDSEAKLANISYPNKLPYFCKLLSKYLPDSLTAAKSFIKNNVPTDLLEPVVRSATTNANPSWLILKDCLNITEYSNIGVSIALTNPNTPPDIISLAMGKANEMTKLIEHICLRGEVPSTILRKLLRSEYVNVAVAAALGCWMCKDATPMDLQLIKDWKSAIIRSAESVDQNSAHFTFWLEEVLSEDKELIIEWLNRLIQIEEFNWGFYTTKFVKKVVATLNEEQRRTILTKIRYVNPSNSVQEFVRELVGGSVNLYSEWLNWPNHKNLHLAPLSGRLTDNWQTKAALALDHGFCSNDIINATQMNGWSWKGSESEMWRIWIGDFERLLIDVDPRIVKLAKQGMLKMSNLEKKARDREQDEMVHGFS